MNRTTILLSALVIGLATSLVNIAALNGQDTPQIVGNLYLSTDRGETWTSFDDGLPADLQVATVWTHPTDDLTYLVCRANGVYARQSGDDCWHRRSNGLPTDDDFFHPLTLAGRGEMLLLTTFYHGHYRSLDRGRNWQRVESKLTAVTGTLLWQTNRLLAGTHDGLWASIDDGTSWEKLDPFSGRINALTELNGRVIVAAQNGAGHLTDTSIAWSGLRTESAIVRLLPAGDWAYAISGKMTLRSRDGMNWFDPPPVGLGNLGLPLAEALWQGYVAKLPAANPTGAIYPSPFGWLANTGNGGC